MAIVVWLFFILAGVSFAEKSDDRGQSTKSAISNAITSAQARSELQLLMDATLFVASQQLNDIGTFYPYAAVMEESGSIKLVGVPMNKKAAMRPKPRQTVKALKKALTQLARKQAYRAMVLFVDFVALRKDTGGRQQGIRIELEHRRPDKLSVFLPYRIASSGEVRLMTPQYMRGRLSVMASP